MILIADCGSTKIDWCLEEGGKEKKAFQTPGMNATLSTREEVEAIINDALKPNLGDCVEDIEHVYFYGAGCLAQQACANVEHALKSCVPNAKIQVASDMVGTCRALCGDQPGIACIMGTGSNSCYYDGEKIVSNVSPLGYILGDEGSGAVLGKLLVGDVLKKQLPEALCQEFLAEYQLDALAIINRVYREPQPNAFLASFMPFIHKHIEHPAIHKLVRDSFTAFFERNVRQYDRYGCKTVHFCGSVAYYFAGLLKDVAAACGYQVGAIIKAPMIGLQAYHGAS